MFGELVNLETTYLGMLAFSGAATNMRRIVAAAGPVPVTDMAARHYPFEIIEQTAYAAAVGGAVGTSTRAGYRYVQKWLGIRHGDMIRVGDVMLLSMCAATIIPAVRKKIPVRVLNSYKPDQEGTIITDEAPPCENPVKAIAFKSGITVVNVASTRMLMAHGFLRRIFEVFDRYQTPVDMVATSEVSVSLTIDDLKAVRSEVPGIRVASPMVELHDLHCHRVVTQYVVLQIRYIDETVRQERLRFVFHLQLCAAVAAKTGIDNGCTGGRRARDKPAPRRMVLCSGTKSDRSHVVL